MCEEGRRYQITRSPRVIDHFKNARTATRVHGVVMPSIVCHPDNWEAVKAKIDRGQFDKPGSMFAEFRVQTNQHMDRDKPTGRYKLPSGKAVAQEEIAIKERFIEYGPEDLEWLLYAGVVTEEREMVFYVIDDAVFRVSYEPIQPVFDRRIIYMPTACSA